MRHIRISTKSAAISNDSSPAPKNTGKKITSAPRNLESKPRFAETVIAANFDGKKSLYDCFRNSCMEQFPTDLVDLESALIHNDMNRVMRISHTLKSALYMLGYECESLLARTLETAAQRGDNSSAAKTMSTLNALLTRILKPSARRARANHANT